MTEDGGHPAPAENSHSPKSWQDLAGRMEGQVHRLPVRIYYEDTDFTGLVYHANYLKFFERGRSDFLRLCGVGHADMVSGAFGKSLAFAIRRMEVDFLRPSRIDDILEIVTEVDDLRGARFNIRQKAELAGHSVATAKVEAVLIDENARPTRFPAQIIERLSAIV